MIIIIIPNKVSEVFSRYQKSLYWSQVSAFAGAQDVKCLTILEKLPTFWQNLKLCYNKP